MRLWVFSQERRSLSNCQVYFVFRSREESSEIRRFRQFLLLIPILSRSNSFLFDNASNIQGIESLSGIFFVSRVGFVYIAACLGNMEPNKEDNVSSVPITQITAAPILQDAGVSAIQPPPFAPPMAPIPMVPHPPLARPPPPFRPPVSQNGGAKTADSDSGSEDEQYIISEGSKQARERQEKALQDLLLKRRAAAMAVPTNDKAVRDRLRRLGEPITLFGEQEMERRSRLAELMARLDGDDQLDKLCRAHEEDAAPKEEADDDIPEYPFFTEGPKELREARIDIAKFSIKRAAVRIQRAKRRRDDPDEDVDAETKWALKHAKGMVLDCSNFGDDRPLTGCSFSRDGKILATWYISHLFLTHIFHILFLRLGAIFARLCLLIRVTCILHFTCLFASIDTSVEKYPIIILSLNTEPVEFPQFLTRFHLY
ncbi:unnamed protein product [Thlaspi arvense]|uniref:Pre-mRNA processing factor 4 (PRP4)-like domain-containing protein n=1 Tax=Thlaspi arvense TaxID=13288 RepID=A0AAU9SAC7_THLAR|nr:unnamed protein product [Thlaspi arvense]